MKQLKESAKFLVFLFYIYSLQYFLFIEISCGRQVYRRSYDICMQLYEKELLTENSYLYIYGYSFSVFIILPPIIVVHDVYLSVSLLLLVLNAGCKELV